MDYQMDMEEQQRIMKLRKTARKLAKNSSKGRTVRKLSQSMVVVPKPKPHKPIHIRKSVNQNKRLTYIMLLGAVMCAYMYDLDQDTLEYMLNTLGHVTQTHLSFLDKI